jgi:catechol 2,3-dioxygenase-like lactoylglutathione lyase family enzyme
MFSLTCRCMCRLLQIIIGERRDPLMFLAMKVKDVKASVAYYKNVLGMKEQPYPLSRYATGRQACLLPTTDVGLLSPAPPPSPDFLITFRAPGSAFEPKQPKGTTFLGYDADGFGLLLAPSERRKPVRVGALVDKLAIASTDVLQEAPAMNPLFAGEAPGIGTRVSVVKDPDGYGIVMVEYEDFEKELA